jgi:glycosyltransferase involved in cell wall biosynthesis
VLWLDGFAWDYLSYPRWVRILLRRTAGLALWFPNMTTVDSIFARNWYQEHYNKAPIHIPYGTKIERCVDEDVLSKYQLKKEKYILFVGRLIPEKGIHYLTEAFGEIETPLKLVIVGDDPFDKRNYVKSLKSRAAKNTKFLGFVYGKDYEELCKGAYLYVMPSTIEGTSPALLAAMGYGNCVLISDIPGNLEVAGDAGVVFETGNVKDLRDKLEYLLNNQHIVEAYRKKVVERVKELYDWDRVTDQIEKMYFSLMKWSLRENHSSGSIS